MIIASLVPCWKLDDLSFICGKSNESCWEMPIIHSLTVMLIRADNYRCHPMWWLERLWRHVHYQNREHMFLWYCKVICILSHYYQWELVRVMNLPVGFLSQVISAINTQQLTTSSMWEITLCIFTTSKVPYYLQWVHNELTTSVL